MKLQKNTLFALYSVLVFVYLHWLERAAGQGRSEPRTVGPRERRHASLTVRLLPPETPPLPEVARALGVDRARLPDNLQEYFGLFASERQNVLKAVEHVRGSPLIGARVPVHGALIDLGTGRIEVIVNGHIVLDLNWTQEGSKALMSSIACDVRRGVSAECQDVTSRSVAYRSRRKERA